MEHWTHELGFNEAVIDRGGHDNHWVIVNPKYRRGGVCFPDKASAIWGKTMVELHGAPILNRIFDVMPSVCDDTWFSRMLQSFKENEGCDTVLGISF